MMNAKAFEILANQGRNAFVNYCTNQRNNAESTGYSGAAEYWEKQLDSLIPLS